MTRRNEPNPADSVIRDPATGYPLLSDAIDYDRRPVTCQGETCRQGHAPCKTPMKCRTPDTRLHRIVSALSHPDDNELRKRPLDQQDDGEWVFWWLVTAFLMLLVAVVTFLVLNPIPTVTA